MGEPGRADGEASGPKRHLRGTVFPGSPAQIEPSALKCEASFVARESCRWGEAGLNKGTLIRAPLPHPGSHQAARAQEGPATGRSTQCQQGFGLWTQPAMTRVPCSSLGLPPRLPGAV